MAVSQDVAPAVEPPLPRGERFELPGRGTTFARVIDGPPGAPTVVLLHGWIASGGLNWFTAFGPLSQRYRVIAPDMRGHGRGIRSRRRFRLADCADDVAALLEQIDAEPAIVVGYSMGGPIAQLVWRRHPDRVAGLVLCATSSRFVRGARERVMFGTMMATAVGTTRTGMYLSRVSTAPMRRWVPTVTTARPTSMRAWAAGEMRRHDTVKLMEAGQAIGSYDARRWIGEITVPTTVLLTERDRAIAPREQLKMAAAIPGAVVQPLDDGHVACAKREFGAALVRAVDSVQARIVRDGALDRQLSGPMGPLQGVRVLEIAGIGPAPFCAMVLADLGADVIRIDRSAGGDPDAARYDILVRGRRSVSVDLKAQGGPEVVLRLVEGADALLEGFRPGVAERLGIGPEACLLRNPRLVYGRMTGWGQDGPLASTAGHDLTYASVAGAVAHIGRAGQPPTPPLNLVADFGGGGMLLAVGLVAGLLHARTTGEGQVVDAAMVDGTALLMAPFFGASAMGFWSDERGTNLLDSGAPFYDVYQCADGLELAVAAIEPQFFAALVDVLQLDAATLPDQNDQGTWPELREAISVAIASRPRDEWVRRAEGTDACVAPVLTMTDAAQHPHVRARGTIVERDGVPQPAPAPRFSRTPAALDRPPCVPGEHTDEVLQQAGFDESEIRALREAGTVQ